MFGVRTEILPRVNIDLHTHYRHILILVRGAFSNPRVKTATRTVDGVVGMRNLTTLRGSREGRIKGHVAAASSFPFRLLGQETPCEGRHLGRLLNSFGSLLVVLLLLNLPRLLILFS